MSNSPLWLAALLLLLPASLKAVEASAEEDRRAVTQHFAPENKTNWTWVFYGDSITQGVAHTDGRRSFTELFAERVRYFLNRREDCIINSGNSGYTTTELLNPRRYDWQVKRFAPNVVVVMAGMNDMVSGRTPETFRENLVTLVQKIRQDGAIPILQTSNTVQKIDDITAAPHLPKYQERYEKLPAYMEIVQTVAHEQSVILIDHYTYWKQTAAQPEILADWLDDPIHPGGKGHAHMAILLLKELGLQSGGITP